MRKEDMFVFFENLNGILAAKGIDGEILLTGGAVMVLAFDARKATKDIDAIMRPAPELREAAREAAANMGLPDDVMNDAVKGFIYTEPEQVEYLQMSNLKVNTVSPEYLLAMKCLSSRMDIGHDKDDIRFLINHLGIESAGDVLDIISDFIPKERVPAKTMFLVEEIFEPAQEKSRGF